MTHVLAGPYCAYRLAVLGADTVKLEPPGDGDMTRVSGAVRELNERGMAPYFLTQNSIKRSLTLDLKTEKGRDIVKRLVPAPTSCWRTIGPGPWMPSASATRI